MYPTIEEIKENFDGYRLVPVFYEILSDTVTPIRIYKALSENEENAFILESVDNKENWGRYSFIGVNPKLEVKITNHMAEVISKDDTVNEIIDNPVQFLSKIMEEYKTPRLKNKPNLTGGLVGYFGYDTVRYMEKKLVNVPEDDLKMPDCDLFMYDELVAFDHLSNKIIVIINIDMQDDIERQYYDAEERAKNIIAKIENYSPKATEKELPDTDYKVKSNVTKEEYMANVEKAKDYIVNGDIFQVVLSQRFEIDNPPESFDVYRMLRATNPSPYLYFFKNKKYEIAGASPEMLVNVTDRIVTTKPIAGTIGRGVTEEEDKAFERQLNSDPKERAEHTMLVDLGRNDVGKVSKFGSVEVTSFMQTERFSKVMHLVSDVQGTLRDDKNAIDALLAVLPAGTLSGAPKVRAMEIIDEMENKKRGLYGGTVGYLGFDGNIDTCIAIRTVLFRNNTAYHQTAAGIDPDTVPLKKVVDTPNTALPELTTI